LFDDKFLSPSGVKTWEENLDKLILESSVKRKSKKIKRSGIVIQPPPK
jgi:hypothetical protein